MLLKPGTRLYSQVDTTEVIVVRPLAGDVVVTCGGHPMLDQKADTVLTAAPETGPGLLIGKRYTLGDTDTLELLVTKPGSYGIAVDGEAVVVKEAKPLPASD